MKAVDTNILVRFLTKDDAIQAQKVYELFKKAETKREPLFVSLLVVLELLWVLESVYSIPREEIVDAINELLYLPVLKFENIPILWTFIKMLQAQPGSLRYPYCLHSKIQWLQHCPDV